MGRVSIIITTFNRPHLLPRAVESALAAGSDVEVIVVDDASTDETAQVCASLSGIKYVRLDRNQGVAGARNVGLLESTSDFIAFLDDDDLRLPGSIDHQLALLETVPEAGFVAGGVLLGDQDCVPTGKVAVPNAESGDLFWKILELSVHLIPAAIVVRKVCFFEAGIFNRHIAGIDDWDMWTRIAGLRTVVTDSRPVCVYRSATPLSGQGSSNLSQHLQAAAKHQKRLLLLPRSLEAPESARRAVCRATSRRLADTLTWRAAEELPRGAFRFSVGNFIAALRLNPFWAARPTHLGVLFQSAAAQLRARRGRPTASIG